MQIEYYISKSQIHGKGIFTNQFIPKNTLIWKLNPEEDLIINSYKLEKLTEIFGKSFFNKFMDLAYFDNKTNKFILHLNGLEKMNHSFTPNCTSPITNGIYNHNELYSIIDIPINTELTENYINYGEDCSKLT
jgi:SET domain-containing protein